MTLSALRLAGLASLIAVAGCSPFPQSLAKHRDHDVNEHVPLALHPTVYAPAASVAPACTKPMFKHPSFETECTFMQDERTTTVGIKCDGCELQTKALGVGLPCQTVTTVPGTATITRYTCQDSYTRATERAKPQVYQPPAVADGPPTPTYGGYPANTLEYPPTAGNGAYQDNNGDGVDDDGDGIVSALSIDYHPPPNSDSSTYHITSIDDNDDNNNAADPVAPVAPPIKPVAPTKVHPVKALDDKLVGQPSRIHPTIPPKSGSLAGLQAEGNEDTSTAEQDDKAEAEEAEEGSGMIEF